MMYDVVLGTGTIDQLVPFQASARLRSPVPVLKLPTAMHDVADVHETPSR